MATVAAIEESQVKHEHIPPASLLGLSQEKMLLFIH